MARSGLLAASCGERLRGRGADAGFTYLTILYIIAFMGVGLALVGEVWHTAQAREREQELLFAGHQFRLAIQRYYDSTPGPAKRYPRALPDLLKDERFPTTQRHLRRLYHDPITGKSEWGIVKAPDGGVMGVYSLSEDKPLKSANFRPRDKEFAGTARYTDWKFVYLPTVQPAKPGAKPAPGTPAGPTGTPLPPQTPGSPAAVTPAGTSAPLPATPAPATSPFGMPIAPPVAPSPPTPGGTSAPLPTTPAPATSPFGMPIAPPTAPAPPTTPSTAR